jgi:crossover junction endodeoxyribonuclease RuvC
MTEKHHKHHKHTEHEQDIADIEDLLYDEDPDVIYCIGTKAYLFANKYAPKKIKMAITGQGNASKEQVAGILQSMMAIVELPRNLDATDGLAAAVCHFYQKDIPDQSGGYNSWKEFISKNPGRIKGR